MSTWRFALAPKGAGSPLATMRQALREQGWRPARSVTMLSDGEAALPGLVRAAVDEPIICILDWWHTRCGCSTSNKRCAASTRLILNAAQI